MGEERRRHKRYAVRTPVVFRSGSCDRTYITQDVSFSGLFVRTDAPPRLRQLVKIHMELPTDGTTFTTLAMCVFVVEPGDHDRVPGVGVQFYGIADDQERLWNGFVEHVRSSASVEIAPMECELDVPDAIRRRHERYAAVIEVVPESLDELITLYNRDISQGGMYLVTDHSVPVGTVIRIDVRHPASDDVFDLVCEVRRVETEGEECGLGVEFVDMDDARRENFYKFVYDLLEIDVLFDETVAIGDPDLG